MIVRTLLRDGAIDFEGRFFSARECELRPRGPTPGGPRLLLGSNGPRMLRIAAPHVDAWNSWYADIGNSPPGVAALRDRVDEACRDTGTDPGAIERTVAVFVGLTGGTGRIMGDTDRRQLVKPLSGAPDEIADELRRYAAEGIAEVQLVVDPITRAAIDELAPVLERLDRS